MCGASSWQRRCRRTDLVGRNARQATRRTCCDSGTESVIVRRRPTRERWRQGHNQARAERKPLRVPPHTCARVCGLCFHTIPTTSRPGEEQSFASHMVAGAPDGAPPPASSSSSSSLSDFLQTCELSHLEPVFAAAAATLGDLQARLAANRPLFLSHLKAVGVSKLGERQSLANAISRAEKVGLLAPPVALPHHRPAVFEEDDETLTVRLKIPAAATSNQFKVSIEVNALRVDFCGEPTALVGTLCAVIKPYDSTWEIERSPPPEYDPLCDAADQPPPSDDVIVLTRPRRPGAGAPFSDAVAKRRAPLPAAVDPVSKDKSASPRLSPSTRTTPRRRAARLQAAQIRSRARAAAQRAAAGAQSARPGARRPVGPDAGRPRARLWSPAGTRLVRCGGALHGAPDAPDGCAPFYTWRRRRRTWSTAATRKGLRARDVLCATLSAVDWLVDGAPTPWSGTSLGRWTLRAARGRWSPSRRCGGRGGGDRRR